ncbi:MAG TPA: phytoene/squalene synthase family protein [Gammaproteobacteria bacterium]
MNNTKPLTETDVEFQQRLLQGVARTFALTIPQLPPELAGVVANAYLLCRIADTIEDESAVGSRQKRLLAKAFIDAVGGRASAQDFVARFYPMLSPQRPAAERELVAQTARVIRITHSFGVRQRAQLERCVRIMAKGMVFFQAQHPRNGLPDMQAFDRYCYHVAGVVGELLTGLYCDYSAELDSRRAQLLALAVSFGQGLQMTNILRDIPTDLKRGICWLPRDVFSAAGYDLDQLGQSQADPAFAAGLHRMLAVAHGHLRNALSYTLLLPAQQGGLRKFCLWALGMALLSLRKIHKRPYFTAASQVKIRRASVLAVMGVTALLKGRNAMLQSMFDRLAAPLPAAVPVTALNDPHGPVQAWFEQQNP